MDIEKRFDIELRRAQKAALFLAYAGAVSLAGSLLSFALPERGYGYALGFACTALLSSFVESEWASLAFSLLFSIVAVFLSLALAKMKKAAVFLAPAFLVLDCLLLAAFPFIDYGIYAGESGNGAYFLALAVHFLLLLFLALFLVLYAKLFRLNKKRTAHEQHH